MKNLESRTFHDSTDIFSLCYKLNILQSHFRFDTKDMVGFVEGDELALVPSRIMDRHSLVRKFSLGR